MSVMYTGLTVPKQKPLQAIILDLDLNGKDLWWMPFLPNILAARLVEHVEEHGESIVKPDLTGPIQMREGERGRGKMKLRRRKGKK